ncbi:MAG: RnfABCDGE type electron transport complex subunit G [Bdellovibrionota bacterium]|jgi:electron transport complex protein RnfG
MTDSDLVQITPKNLPNSTLKIVSALTGLATICGLLIAVAVQVSKEPIRKNQEEGLRRAVLEVIPTADKMLVFEEGANGTLQIADAKSNTRKYYAAYNEAGELQGVAFRGVGEGYGGKVKILFGYNHNDESLLGINVIESKETPGLGDKIAYDPEFLANFKDMPLASDDNGLLHKIEVVKGSKKEAWQVSAIAGATISSRAVGTILSNSADQALPLIKKNLDILKRGEGSNVTK